MWFLILSSSSVAFAQAPADESKAEQAATTAKTEEAPAEKADAENAAEKAKAEKAAAEKAAEKAAADKAKAEKAKADKAKADKAKADKAKADKAKAEKAKAEKAKADKAKADNAATEEPAAPPALAEVVGRAIVVRGQVTVTRTAVDFRLTRGALLTVGDQVATAEGSAVRIMLKAGSLIDLGAKTSITLSQPGDGKKKSRSSLRLTIGRLWARIVKATAGEKQFEVLTDNAVAGVRGTELVAQAGATGLDVMVVTGTVEVASTTGDASELLRGMQAGTVGPDGTISTRSITPADLREAREDTQPSAGLSPSELEELDRLIDDDASGEQAPLKPEGSDLPVPPLESEPGVGKGQLRGTITAEDD